MLRFNTGCNKKEKHIMLHICLCSLKKKNKYQDACANTLVFCFSSLSALRLFSINAFLPLKAPSVLGW